LIDLFTYEGDVVLDPFIGSGSTALAAIRSDRHFVGFDTDAAYVAKARNGSSRSGPSRRDQAAFPGPGFALLAKALTAEGEDELSRGLRQGLQARELAGILLGTCGFVNIRPDVKIPGLGLEVHFLATDQTGGDWAFDVSGSVHLQSFRPEASRDPVAGTRTGGRSSTRPSPIWPSCCSPPTDRSGEVRVTSHLMP